jgi:O-antigen ligase
LLALAALAVLSGTVYLSWPERRAIVEEASSAVGAFVARYRALDDRLALAITAAAAILVVVAWGTVPTIAALALLGLLLVLRPDMGLPLIAVALPFYQPGKPLLGRVFSMVEILTLLTAAGWALNQVPSLWRGSLRHALRGRRPSALDWGVIALVALGAASLLWTEQGRVAAREFRTVVLGSAIFYGLLRAMVRDRGGAWRMADAWILGGAVIALVGIVQWAFGSNLITADGVWRVRGFYGSPNNLALYLGRMFPLVIAVAAWGKRGRRRWLYALGAALMALALVLTYSRGAWLLGIPISLLFLAALRGRRAFLLAAGALLLAAVLLILLVGPGRLTSLLDTAEGTTFFRLQLWQSSLSMIRDQPLQGVGLDNFLYAYRTHYVLPTAWEEFNLSHPHNLLLDFWLRLGLPGLLLLGWFLFAFFRRGWRAYRRLRPERDEERLLVMGLMAGMINFLAHGLVDNAFFLVDLAFTFMLMAALVQIPKWQTLPIPDPDRESRIPTDV